MNGDINDLYQFAEQYNKKIKIKLLNKIPAYISDPTDLGHAEYEKVKKDYDKDSWKVKQTNQFLGETALTIEDGKIWKNIINQAEKDAFYEKHAIEVFDSDDYSYLCETLIPEGEYIIQYIKDDGYDNEVFKIITDITNDGKYNNYNMFWMKNCDYCDKHDNPSLEYELLNE